MKYYYIAVFDDKPAIRFVHTIVDAETESSAYSQGVKQLVKRNSRFLNDYVILHKN